MQISYSEVRARSECSQFTVVTEEAPSKVVEVASEARHAMPTLVILTELPVSWSPSRTFRLLSRGACAGILTADICPTAGPVRARAGRFSPVRRVSGQLSGACGDRSPACRGVQIATHRAKRDPAAARKAGASSARGARRPRGAEDARWRTRQGGNARCPGMQGSHSGASMQAIECVYRGWRDYVSLSAVSAREKAYSDPLRR